MSDDNKEFLEKQRQVAQAMGKHLAQLRESAADEELFVLKGLQLAKDMFQAGFDNGERAGYNQGYHAAIKEMMDRVDKKIQELK